MPSSSSVVPLRQPDTVDNPLTAVLRDGARRLLEGAGRGVADHPASTLHGPQDRQCAGQVAQVGPAGGQGQPAQGLERTRPGAGGGGHRDVCGEAWAKYDRAVTCLTKDQGALPTFRDVPAEHGNLGRNAWRAHLRTSNPIESVSATVRHRTVRTKGALSQDTARLMVPKLVMLAAEAQPPSIAAAKTHSLRRPGGCGSTLLVRPHS